VKRRAKQRYLLLLLALLLKPSGGCKLKVKMDKEPDSLDGVASDARNQSDSKYDANMVRCSPDESSSGLAPSRLLLHGTFHS
jgi:hypothetical protein